MFGETERENIRTGFAIESYHHPMEDDEHWGELGPDVDQDLVYIRVLDDDSGFLVTKWWDSHEGGYFDTVLDDGKRVGHHFRTYYMIEFDPLKMLEASNAWEQKQER